MRFIINLTLNVVCNIIGSGTALTNLSYNAITNKPDLSGYATNTILNSLSTNSVLNLSNLPAILTTLLNMINYLTGSSTITNVNNLSTYSALNISNLQATSTTFFNKTNFSSLNVVDDINTPGLSVFGTNSALSSKQNNLTFSHPFLNTSRTISLKYDNTKFKKVNDMLRRPLVREIMEDPIFKGDQNYMVN
jgi:hypothetical protein